MRKPCIQCGAPIATGSHRCDLCKIVRSRPSAWSRGYNTAHKQARADMVGALPTPCGYGCGKVLAHESELVAAHVIDGNPDAGWLPSCRSCNERAKRR
jgi:hypothetical protein